MYIKRTLEDKFLRMSAFFKAVLVTGARQVGKTTMLRHLAGERTFVSLDDTEVCELARRDPQLFFLRYKPPILIDEVQKAPELFPYIKIMCDDTEEKGLFWLTGSEQYTMMQEVKESLAGRIGIMTLYPLSFQELSGVTFSAPLDLSMEGLLRREAQAKPYDLEKVFEFIWRGGLPQVQGATEEERSLYFRSYIDSYLLRDASQAGGVTDELRFQRFLTACAAGTAEQLNLSNLALIAEISVPTAKAWLGILQKMHIVYLLQPYANNRLKRLTKTPKLYFTDTGLAAYLTKWLNRDVLLNGNAAGHYFENFAVMELIKDLDYSSQNYDLSYFRDSNQKEVDLFLEMNGAIHPLEIKLSANPDKREVKKYTLLDKNSLPRGNGGIICMSRTVLPIDEQNCFIPANLL